MEIHEATPGMYVGISINATVIANHPDELKLQDNKGRVLRVQPEDLISIKELPFNEETFEAGSVIHDRFVAYRIFTVGPGGQLYDHQEGHWAVPNNPITNRWYTRV